MTKDKGEYYAEEEDGNWHVFHTDKGNGKAYGSFSTKNQAEEHAKKLNDDKLKENINAMKAKIAEAKFSKLVVPAISFNGKKVETLTKHFNESFGSDFSIDTSRNKIINLTESNNEFKMFNTFEKFLTSKGIKTQIVEYDTDNKLSHLLENELEKAQVVLAAQDILDSLQKSAEAITKVQTDSVMPLVDEIKMQFGTDIADKFSNIAKSTLDAAFEAIRASKDQIGNEVTKMNAVVNGEDYPTDLSNDENNDFSDDEGGNDLEDALKDTDSDNEIDLDADDSLDVDSDSPLGRMKKESINPRKKAVTEGKSLANKTIVLTSGARIGHDAEGKPKGLSKLSMPDLIAYATRYSGGKLSKAKIIQMLSEGEGLRRANAAVKKANGKKLSKQDQKDLDADTLANRMQNGDKKKK